MICLFVDPTSYSWYFPARFLVVFLSKHKLQYLLIILWDSLALEDVHVLQHPRWRKKTLRRPFLWFFWGMSTYSLPIKECNHATQNYVIEKQQLNFDFEARDVWVWIITIEACDALITPRPSQSKTVGRTQTTLAGVKAKKPFVSLRISLHSCDKYSWIRCQVASKWNTQEKASTL